MADAGNAIVVRLAGEADATAIVRVTRASITELCVADHHGDAQILARWLANKTVDSVLGWLRNPINRNVIAERGGEPVGAGCVQLSGHIVLNYVAPWARFQGVSDAMLTMMETLGREAGLTALALESTNTAHRFYLERGYVDSDTPGEKFGVANYQMRKSLI